ncbi:GNAT family N-acetyltransferase [Polyangium mundeleinium]|uniref:GNAT family N-acetyltransferase n=1 Tax=Polyangium mundeleinium TaxID=2995306 RepID=A0ABT5ER28_9BACT|nr:GNAT family N-acetyltransferase [Polyangium mundeleinium]MDC0744268.1 GNAT family N-acetyltransferase [Polyangium mundeleinium]
MSRIYVPQLDDALVAEAARQTHVIWSGGRSVDAYIEAQRAQLRRAGPAILRYTGLLDDTGRLVAGIKRYGLSVSVPGGGKAPGVGIGAVFTRPEARGTGAASELLRAVLEEARANGVALALLFSDIDPGFYERLGFVALPALEHTTTTSALPAETSLDVRPSTPEDERWMLDTYDASWDPSFVRPARTLEILRYFRFRNHGDLGWILRRDGRDVGYVLAALHGGNRDDGAEPPPRTLWVDEWAAPGIPRDDILGALRRIAFTEGAAHVASWLPPPLEGEPFVARNRPTAIAMVLALGGGFPMIDPGKTFFGSLDHF